MLASQRGIVLAVGVAVPILATKFAKVIAKSSLVSYGERPRYSKSVLTIEDAGLLVKICNIFCDMFCPYSNVISWPFNSMNGPPCNSKKYPTSGGGGLIGEYSVLTSV